MRLDPGKAVAVTCTLALHALVLAWLMKPAALPPLKVDEPSVSIVWIARPRAQPQTNPQPLVVIARHPRPLRRTQSPSASVRTTGSHAPPVSEPPPQYTTADDTWAQRDATSAQANAFERRLSRDQTDPVESRPRVVFNVRDSSLMGRLKRMSESSICNELLTALRSATGGDADVIVRTMRERGCRV